MLDPPRLMSVSDHEIPTYDTDTLDKVKIICGRELRAPKSVKWMVG